MNSRHTLYRMYAAPLKIDYSLTVMEESSEKAEITLPQLLENLKNESAPLNSKGLRRLSALDKNAAKPFLEVFARMSEERRLDFIETLSEIADDDPELDFTLIFAIGIRDTDDGVRARSVAALWESDSRDFMITLLDMIRNDSSEEVRAAAASNLRRFANMADEGRLLAKDKHRIADALLETIHNFNEPVSIRRRAVESLGALAIPERDQEIRAAFNSGDPKMKASAIYAMGITFDDKWLPDILKEIHNPDAEVRYEAATACGELEAQSAILALLPLVKDVDTRTRLAAITSLGQMGGPQARRMLEQLMLSDDEVVSQTAEEALAMSEGGEDPMKFRGF